MVALFSKLLPLSSAVICSSLVSMAYAAEEVNHDYATDLQLSRAQLIKLQPLIDKEQIASKITEIAQRIDEEYANKDLVILMVLKGAICFVSDLIRAIQIPCDIEMIQCRSYGQRGTSRGELQIDGLDQLELKGRDVLLIDDIFDSGQTLTSLVAALQHKKVNSLKSLVLLEKQVPHVSDYRPDYALFKIEDRFVVGYGLDYKERYRGLTGIFVLDPDL